MGAIRSISQRKVLIKSMFYEFKNNMLDKNEYESASEAYVYLGLSYHIYYLDGSIKYLDGTSDPDEIKNTKLINVKNIIEFGSEGAWDFFTDKLPDIDPVEWVMEQDYMR